MTRTRASVIAAATFAALGLAMATRADAQSLGTAGSYAVLAGSTITNTGTTIIIGDIGVSPGTAITGGASIVLTGTVHNNDGPAGTAQSDLTIAYNALMSAGTTTDLTGQDLGGLTLIDGVYNYAASAQLTGTLTLDGQGNPAAVFIVKVGTALTTASNSSVVLINGAQASNVFFVVGSSATLGTTTNFAGKIVALSSITLNTAAIINCGAALARNGAVTLDSNTINNNCALAVAPGTYVSALGPDATANEIAVAEAIAAYTGTPSIAFQALPVALTAEQLAAAYTELSGEAATGVAPAASQAMNSFMSQLFDTAFDENRGSPATPPSEPSTVRTLGYASERAPSPGPAAAFAPLKPTFAPGRWGVWAAGYGGTSDTAGDALIGSHDRSATTFGFSAGFDQRVTAASTLGVAFGAGHTDFGLADGLGGGDTTTLQAALYSRTNFGAAYVSTALAYAYNNVSTDRFVSVGSAHYAANFAANDIAGRVEVGYGLEAIAPYAAVQLGALFTPAYDETTVSGAPTFALHYDASTTTRARTELGARFSRIIAIHDGDTLTLRARAAWAHDYGSEPSSVAGFQELPGPTFTVQGATAARDSLLLSAGAEFGFGNGFAVAALFDSAFAANSQTYWGTGRISYRW